jgi:hypothetical protein
LGDDQPCSGQAIQKHRKPIAVTTAATIPADNETKFFRFKMAI